MNGQELRAARLRKDWTQQQTAEKLGVTQAYLSMLEHGRRPLPYSLARKAVEALHAPATALPFREDSFGTAFGSEKLRSELAALGYPGFAHLRGRVRHEGDFRPSGPSTDSNVRLRGDGSREAIFFPLR